MVRSNVVAFPAERQGVPVERAVTKQQAALALSVTPQTLDRWVREGMPEDIPGERAGCWFRVGHRRRYYVGRVRAYWRS